MNIYRITEDCESFCIKANSMHEATQICENSYIDEIAEQKDLTNKNEEAYERDYYRENILHSCELVGQLKN